MPDVTIVQTRLSHFRYRHGGLRLNKGENPVPRAPARPSPSAVTPRGRVRRLDGHVYCQLDQRRRSGRLRRRHHHIGGHRRLDPDRRRVHPVGLPRCARRQQRLARAIRGSLQIFTLFCTRSAIPGLGRWISLRAMMALARHRSVATKPNCLDHRNPEASVT